MSPEFGLPGRGSGVPNEVSSSAEIGGPGFLQQEDVRFEVTEQARTLAVVPGRNARGDDGEDLSFVRPGSFLVCGRFPGGGPGLVTVLRRGPLFVVLAFPSRRMAVRRGS
eukprot:2575710-Heterocapsa_arctica.AAC.1